MIEECRPQILVRIRWLSKLGESPIEREELLHGRSVFSKKSGAPGVNMPLNSCHGPSNPLTLKKVLLSQEVLKGS